MHGNITDSYSQSTINNHTEKDIFIQRLLVIIGLLQKYIYKVHS